MKQLILVGVGGCLGAIARYKLGGWVLHHTLDWRFPLGTIIVNVVGCLVAGLLTGLIEKHHVLTQDARVFLFTGLLGGFTTFSAFGLETGFLMRRGEFAVAMLYVVASVAGGIAAFWLGDAVI
jgi:CrcB protein